MRAFITTILLFGAITICKAQNIGIGTNSPHSSAIVDISSSTKGFLTPRMSTSSRTGIVNPQKGLIVFDNNTASYWYFGDGAWKEMTAGGNSSDSTMLVGDPNPGPLSQYLISGSSAFDTSGIIFDTGGEFGNYGNNENFEFNVYPSLLFNALGVKVTILQMTLENINDSVIISGSTSQKRYFTGTVAPQQFILNGGGLRIVSKTNASGVAAGFKIRFDFIFPSIQQSGTTQISGWTYIPSKLSVRGGFDAEYNSQPDSVGVLSFGFGNSVIAKGRNSIAFGDFVSATGVSSVAIGSFSEAYGTSSVAIGESVEATGSNSIAIGYQSEASGNYAIACGYFGKATGGSSFATNSNTQAIGTSSASFGRFTRSHGTASMALGENSESFGANSVAMGRFTNAYGGNSVSIGSQTNTYGAQAFSLGADTKAIGISSVASGDRSRSTGNLAIASGKETVARAYASLTIGQFNDSLITSNPDTWVDTDPVFIIGNGLNNSTRSNALTVLKNGTIGISTATPEYGLHVVNANSQDGGYLQGIMVQNTASAANAGEAAVSYRNNSFLSPDGKWITGLNQTSSFRWDYSTSNFSGSAAMALDTLGNLSILGTLSQSSDARLKKNITPLQNSLEKILQLGGYQYEWNDIGRGDRMQSGVLAQEVEVLMPELVSTDKEGVKSVNYSGLIPYLIESIKELKKENQELRKSVELLKVDRK